MPIKPENAGRYPADWREVRARILKRAGDCCEWEGCGAPNGILIARSVVTPERWFLARDARAWGDLYQVRVVLTIAHLDHQPENNDPANLLALCQLHHNRYDVAHRAETRRATRRERSGQLEMFAR